MKRVYVSICALIALSVCGPVFGAGGSLPGDGLTAETAFQIQDLDDFRVFADPANAATYWASGVHTELTCHLNLSGENYTTAVIAPDTNSTSINWEGTPYQGFFRGNGFEISNMTIDDKDDCVNNVGLFGRIEGGTVEDLGIVNCTLIIGDDTAATRRLVGYVGALCGNFYGGTLNDCYTTGSIQASSHCVALTTSSTPSSVLAVGGLCGSFTGILDHCYSACSVNASASDYYAASMNSIGGLCGSSSEYGTTISNSDAVGAVTININRFPGGNYYSLYRLQTVGGFIGQSYAVIQNCYSSGTVQCSVDNHNNGFAYTIGGLIGYNKGPVHDSYSTSPISIRAVGDRSSGQCYQIGGLIGTNGDAVDNCYAAAEFSATASSNNYTSTANQGGLIGYNSGTVTDSFWDTEVADPDMTVSAGGTGKTTGEMQNESTFIGAGWDFDAGDGSADWLMGGYPQLAWRPVERVDLDELETLAQYWLMTGCTSDQPCAVADWYTDGKIDLLDFMQLAQSWLAPR